MSKKKGFDDKIKADLVKGMTGEEKEQPKKPKMGRPKATHGKKRYSVILEPEYIAAAKYIAMYEACQISEVFSKAISGYIEKFEKEHGKLPARFKKPD